MAVDSTPNLSVRQSLLAKIETTTGTAISLAADDGKFNCYNVTPSYDIPQTERPAQASFGVLESIAGTRFGAIEFESDLCGLGSSGAVPYWATTFLPACGFTQSSSTFSLAYNASQPTLTIGAYFDGVKFAISGAAGTVSTALTAGQPARLKWRFVGKIETDSDVALVTPTAFSTNPPRFAGDTVSLGGTYTPFLNTIEIDVGNQLQMRPYQGDATGGRACIITGRRPTFTMDPELQLVATRNWLSNFVYANASESFSAAVGTSANNIITFSSTYAQYLEVPPGERNGLRTRQIKGQFCRDSLSIAFS